MGEVGNSVHKLLKPPFSPNLGIQNGCPSPDRHFECQPGPDPGGEVDIPPPPCN